MKHFDIAGGKTGPKRLDLRPPAKRKHVIAQPTTEPADLESRKPEPEIAKPKTEIPQEEYQSVFEKPTEPKDLWEDDIAQRPERVDQIFPDEEEVETKKTETEPLADPISPPPPEDPLPPAEKQPTPSPTEKKTGRLLIWKSVIAVIVIVLLAGTALFGQAFFTGASIFNQEGTSTLDQLKHLVLSGDNKLEGEEDGRINVLLLGKGGAGHSGANLTDTVIVLSIKPDTQQVAMLSLPRDLWVESEEFGYSRINKVNYYGESEHGEGEGPKAVRDVVEDVTGLDIPYYVSIDFDGFREIVDSLGGVDIDVENGFIDQDYPTANYGYQTVEFDRGVQHMDGETALNYARSRHGVITDPDPEQKVINEASDFARSRRQQKLIAAIKDKALSTGVLANPQKLTSLLEALGNHMDTNAQMWEGVRLFQLAQEFDINNVKVSVITTEEFLQVYITPDGAYTLIPTDGFNEYGKIQEYALNIWDRGENLHGDEIALPTGDAPEEERPSGYEELTDEETAESEETTASVAIQNGTTVTGLASKTASELRAAGFEIAGFSNAINQSRQHTVIYDNTGGEKPQQLQELADRLQADILEEQAPANKSGVQENADFVIIIGQESVNSGYTNI